MMLRFCVAVAVLLFAATNVFAADITVGFVTSLSGPGASIGIPYEKGILAADAYAGKVGDTNITVQEVRQQLDQIEQRNQVPKALEGLYAQQILQQLVFEKEIEYEASRLGITVSDQERADRA